MANMRLISKVSSVAGLAVILGSSLVLAQDSAKQVANVPFAFHARQTTLPAGSYVVKAINSAGVMQILDAKTGHSIMLPTGARESGRNTTARLTFHRYGSEYFLSDIWMAGQVNGYAVGKSTREKELAQGPGQLALATVRFQSE